MSDTGVIERAVRTKGGRKPPPEIAAEPPQREVVIAPPKFERAVITIQGDAPYCQHKFSAKARQMIIETQMAGSVSRKGKKREPRDFDADYRGAMHVSREGWVGIPCASFRNAMISACRLAGFVMTRAKLSLFVEPDGFDADDGTPLTRIIGEPVQNISYVRNETGVVDIRCRPLWEQWSAEVSLKWDADQFSAADVVNLLSRAGVQVGIGEGRPDSPRANGVGWGTFVLL